MGTILECRDLHFAWQSQNAGWLQAVELELKGGHIYGLMGRNGAGKTTLIKLLCGLLRPTSGKVRVEAGGKTFEAFDRRPEMLTEMVFVPESSDLPAVSVTDLGKLVGALYPRFSTAAYHSHLQALEVPNSARIQKLSFGQRRKVHIAFALATDASLIFLDEPSNGLDIAAQVILRKLLISHVSPERSIVVSTHHVREFENVIDEVLVLERGRFLAHEPLEALRDQLGFQDLESWYARLVGVIPSTTQAASQGVFHNDRA